MEVNENNSDTLGKVNGAFNSEDATEIPKSLASPSPNRVTKRFSCDSDDITVSCRSCKSDPSLIIIPSFVKSNEKKSQITFTPSNYDNNNPGLFLTSLKKRRAKGFPYFGHSKNQLAALLVIGFANVLATTVISMQGPFYPLEAERKGASATEYGLVFGVFELTMFIMCPVFGTLLGGTVPPKLMLCLGMFITGSCALVFGFLDHIEGARLFIATSFICRIIQACGDSAYMTASFTIIALEFPNSVGTAFAILEVCSGVGLIIGPTVGGVLYELGGFLLPFLSMGTLLLVMAVFTCIFLPVVESESSESKGERENVWSLIQIPSVALSTFAIVVSASGMGFLSATLEPHVRANFNLTPVYTGLIFIIEAGMYALSAPIWGHLCDNTPQPKRITLLGSVLCFGGFTLIGPAPFMPFEPILWVSCIGLAAAGLGLGASQVSGFIQNLQDALANGFQDNISTYGLVSGLWSSSLALGCFIGPTIGGVLLDTVGFRYGSIYVLATQCIVASLVIIFQCVSRKRNPNGPSLEPLRSNEAVSFNFFDENKGHVIPTSKSGGTLSTRL
ncbi:unnamed protein product [Allacma fusca]|uniref:Major facilitator superfamily (MFS) profile domain-containing protein n=1 Tax=Allacma fusca TaxID=39272 RepID=A0A8J2KZW9_9HEXA|nr:unnamed protein product [Allacma fusca]